MSALSEDVKIYGHVYHIRQIIVHPDGKRCITVSDSEVKMFSLLSHEHLMDFDLSSIYIWDAALFDNETLMAYTWFDGIEFRSLSNGAISLRYSKRETKGSFSGYAWIFPLRPNQFMVIGSTKNWRGAFSGKAIAYMLEKPSPEVPAADSATLRVLSTCTFPEFRDVCSHGNRFVTAMEGKSTVQVWGLESDKFQRIKVLDVGFVVSTFALSDKYIMCAEWKGLSIRIYNSSTAEFIRQLTSPLPFSERVTIWGDYFLIIGGEDETTVALLDVEGGEILWKKDFEFGIKECQLSVSKEFGAKLIVGTWDRKVLQCSLPSDIASKLLESDSSALCVLPPLQKALSRCLAGEVSPAEYCNSLITFSACSASFPEWCSAHQLLVLAVRNGEINKSTEHNDSIAHWFENLYLAMKDLDLTSDEDLVVAKRYLREAKRMGLIETIEAVLAALHVTSQVREEVRTLHRAGILIFEQVMRIEKRFDMLKESCEQYRKYQMYSQCIGIALQIIPIVGGASAGVITAGANIVEGLSIKDVADYAFGLGSSLTEGEIPSFGYRVFRGAAKALRPEYVAKMNEEERRLVEEAVSSCELSLEELRRLFIERSKESCETCTDEIELGRDEVDCTVEPDMLGRDDVFANEISEVEKSNIGSCDDVETCIFVEESVPRVSNSLVLAGETKEEKDVGCILAQAPSDLKTCKVKKDSIEGMTQIEIAALCAAFIVRFEDSRVDMFVTLRDRIVLLFEENQLDGAVIADRQALSVSELAETILDGLRNDGKGTVPLGDKGRVRQFFNMVG